MFYQMVGSLVAKGGPWDGKMGCNFPPKVSQGNISTPYGVSSRGLDGQRKLQHPWGGYN